MVPSSLDDEQPEATRDTTLSVSKAQRASIAEIAAILTRRHGRRVGTKEVISALINTWKEHESRES